MLDVYFTPRFDIAEIKEAAASGDAGTYQVAKFTGLASTFGNVDIYQDRIKPGAFKGLDPKRVKMLHSHDMREVIGRWTSIKQDDRGLHVEGELNLATRRGAEDYALMKQGAITDLSVGFRVPRGKVSYDEQEDGTFIRDIEEALLFEISVVAIGANDRAKIQAVKSFKAEDVTERQIEIMLREQLGMSRREAQAFMSCGYKGLIAREAQPAEQRLQRRTADVVAIRGLAASILELTKSA